MESKRLLPLLFLLISMAGAQQSPAPVVFFTDLTSGPATGNSDTSYSATGGAYVTIYGNNFGSSQGSSTVTLNGASCLTVVSWGKPWMWYQTIVVKLGTACASGAFSVTVGAQPSNCADIGNFGNSCNFTVRPGNIRYVSTSGNDSTGTGSFSAPWATLTHARDNISAGDTIYAENGVCACSDDGSGWGTTFLLDGQEGTSGHPMALVAYPGASVTIGTTSTSACGGSGCVAIKTKGNSGAGQSYWTFAGLTLRANITALSPNMYASGSNTVHQPGDWRLIANDISCPTGGISQAAGCMDTTAYNNSVFLGNNAHNMGEAGSSAQYQGIYFSTDSYGNEVAWNTIDNTLGCRDFQTNSSIQAAGSGHDLYNFTVHDNTMYAGQCDAIVLNDVDPSSGIISVYNNVIFDMGLGNTPENSGAWNCVYMPGATEAGPVASGNVEVYNNSFYGCGMNTNPPYPDDNACVNNGGHNSNLNIHMRNNICYQTTASVQLYYEAQSGSGADGVFGVNNIMYGIGAPPSSNVVTGTINSDPKYVNATLSGCPSSCTTDLHLSTNSSPAVGAGNTTGLVPTFDHDGLLRPGPPSIGAYEFASGVRPNPPTNLTATVN